MGWGVHRFRKISLKMVVSFLYLISTLCIMINVENPLQIITAKLYFPTKDVSCVILRSNCTWLLLITYCISILHFQSKLHKSWLAIVSGGIRTATDIWWLVWELSYKLYGVVGYPPPPLHPALHKNAMSDNGVETKSSFWLKCPLLPILKLSFSWPTLKFLLNF